MKTKTFSLLLLFLLPLNGCQQFNQGAPGDPVQRGVDRAEGSTPYALGRTSPLLRAGMPHVNMAHSRLESGLATSPSGRAELSRRAAAAIVRSPSDPAVPFEPEVRPLDDILLNRIYLALSATTPDGAEALHALSIQTWNNLQISAQDGSVLLHGRVGTPEEKHDIGRIVRQVEGVKSVRNELMIRSEPEPRD